MKKHLVILSLALATTQVSAALFFPNDFFPKDFLDFFSMPSGEINRRMVAAEKQADYTMQHSQDNNSYVVTVTLCSDFAHKEPEVAIKTMQNQRGKEVKELELIATMPVTKDKKDAQEARATYSSYSYSSTVVTMGDGAVCHNGRQSSRAVRENGKLVITHQLPAIVNEEDYVMSFDKETRVFVIKFGLKKEASRLGKRVLSYSAAATEQAGADEHTDK